MRCVFAVATAALCVLTAGCLARGEFRPTHYYTLTVPDPTAGEGKTLALTASVRQFSAVRAYDQRIVRRESAVQLRYEEYHRWSESPDELVGDIFATSLASRGVFRSVAGPALDVDTDVIIEGRVLTFEQDADDNAVCALSLTLRRRDEDKPLWLRTLAAKTPISGRTHADLARAMSVSLREIVDQCVADWSELPQLAAAVEVP